MIRGLLGKKLGMTQIFDKEGNVIPVTLVEAGPCTVLELKENPLKVKVGFGSIREKVMGKPRIGYFKKLSLEPKRFVREFASSDNKDYKVGQEIKAELFKAGDYVDVAGVSIGKGFQGGMKRHGWSGGGAGHGSMHHRRVGSVSTSADPSRIMKGKTMPGHMGDAKVTVQSLRVMLVDPQKNVIAVKGAVPGGKNSILEIILSRKRKYQSLDEKKAVVQHKVNPMKQAKKAAGAAAKKAAAATKK
jgi:large subunit ribosomal protein L3